MSPSDLEILRARWRREHESRAIDRTDRADFLKAGLASRLQNVSSQLLLLPADPVLSPVSFDGQLEKIIKARGLELDHLQVSTPRQVSRSAHALVAYESYGDMNWSTYLAVERSGAVEVGLGQDGGREGVTQRGEQARLVYLTPLVVRTWSLLLIAAEIQMAFGVVGPWQLSLGVASNGAELGVLSEGWAEPGSWEHSVPACSETGLVWRMEFQELPQSVDAARDVAYAVGDRLEDAWGRGNRRFLANRGDFKDRIHPRYVY